MAIMGAGLVPAVVRGREAMKKAELDRLKEAGWEVTTVQNLLGLPDAENKIVEMKLPLSLRLKKQLQDRHISHRSFARS